MDRSDLFCPLLLVELPSKLPRIGHGCGQWSPGVPQPKMIVEFYNFFPFSYKTSKRFEFSPARLWTMSEARTPPCLLLWSLRNSHVFLRPTQATQCSRQAAPTSWSCTRTWSGLPRRSTGPSRRTRTSPTRGATAALTVCEEEGLPAQWWPLVSHTRSNSSSVSWHSFHWKTRLLSVFGWFNFQIFVNSGSVHQDITSHHKLFFMSMKFSVYLLSEYKYVYLMLEIKLNSLL